MKVSIDHSKLIDVTEAICDGYCKWPFNTMDQKELNDKCDECPLNNILSYNNKYPLGRNDYQE